MKDKDWRRLLDQMRDGMVVPVIGSRLLVDAQGQPLSARLARLVIEGGDLDVDPATLPPFREINEIVTRLKAQRVDPITLQELYGDIDAALRKLDAEGLEVPQPLRQLAAITDFRLMVTVTCDGLLERALSEAGRGVKEVVHSPKLPTSEGADLPLDWQERQGVVHLLYLFGKSRPTPLFAIHDEDVLEYAHNVIADGSHAPTAFLGALRDRSLLIVGCNFPDWLSRFVLRATRKGRLADPKGGREWLVEGLGKEDPFVGFLGSYSPETEALTNIDPAQFVDELYRRWVAEQKPAANASAAGGAGAAADAANAAAEPAGTPDGRMFFISYSRTTDLAQAQALKDALVQQLSVGENEIWFDRETLEPGDIYTRRILDGIRGCRYFVPLVSRAATGREQAFVFREWDEATRQLPEMNRKYLLPLVVDADNHPETYRQASVLEWLERKINFWHAPNGKPDEAALKALRELVRDARRPRSAA